MKKADLPGFLSRVERIRVRSLRNFLRLYFYAYVLQKGLTSSGLRRPKVFPGWRGVKSFLGCSKDTAIDYLRALKLMHEIMAVERGLPPLVKDSEYGKLLNKAAKQMASACKDLRGNPASMELYKVLREIARDLRCMSASFTSNQCAKIIDEIASWFI